MNVKPNEERKTMRMKLKLNSKKYEKLKRYTQESRLRSMSQYMLNPIIAIPIIEITGGECDRAEYIYMQLISYMGLTSAATRTNNQQDELPRQLAHAISCGERKHPSAEFETLISDEIFYNSERPPELLEGVDCLFDWQRSE